MTTITQSHKYLVDRGWGFAVHEGRYKWVDPEDPTRATVDTARAVARQRGREAAQKIAEKGART